MKKLILTVCNGNIHRSVIAAVCIHNMIVKRGLEARYEVMSRGLQGTQKTERPDHLNLREYPLEWPLTSPILEELGIEISADQQSTPITREIAERASIILAMDKKVLSEKANCLQRQFPDLAFKIHLFCEITGSDENVPDPAGNRDPEVHRKAVSTIFAVIQQHPDDLLRLVEGKRVELATPSAIRRKAMHIVSGARHTVCMTMEAEEELQHPSPKEFFPLVSRKLRQSIRVTRIGFGSVKDFRRLRRKVDLKHLHRRYTFHRTDAPDYQRMLLVDDSKLMFRESGHIYYSEDPKRIAECKTYFQKHMPKK